MERKLTTITIILSLLIGCFSMSGYAETKGKEYKQFLDEKIAQGVNIEEFKRFESVNRSRVEKLNKLIETVDSSYQHTQNSSLNILGNFEQNRETNQLTANRQIAISQKRREGAASRATGYNYVAHTDGSKTTFKNGLVCQIDNERVVDEFGNASLKDTYNMEYNGKRLLTGYEADVTDELGNESHIEWKGAKYAKGSLFYGNNYGEHETNAYKTIIGYEKIETDHAGNTRKIKYQANDHKGKYIYEEHTDIYDSVYGNTSFTRSGITYKNKEANHVYSYTEEGTGPDGLPYHKERLYTHYNKEDQVTGYYEETEIYDYDGVSLRERTTTLASFEYLRTPHKFGRDVEKDPDKLTKSVIKTTSVNANGKEHNQTAVTNYEYNEKQNLIAASGTTEFNGQKPKWWEYKDSQGNILTRTEDKNGNINYSYVNSDNQRVIVEKDQVTATLKDGNYYKGSSDISYEIFHGKPMQTEVNSKTSYYGSEDYNTDLVKIEDTAVYYENDLVNNIRRTTSMREKTNITFPVTGPQGNNLYAKLETITSYIYAKNGNLINAVGLGTGKGYEFSENTGWRTYQSNINIDYDVILGNAKQTEYEEIKYYE